MAARPITVASETGVRRDSGPAALEGADWPGRCLPRHAWRAQTDTTKERLTRQTRTSK